MAATQPHSGGTWGRITTTTRRRFLRLAGSGEAAAIHRQIWAPGVETPEEAFLYLNRLVCKRIAAGACPAGARPAGPGLRRGRDGHLAGEPDGGGRGGGDQQRRATRSGLRGAPVRRAWRGAAGSCWLISWRCPGLACFKAPRPSSPLSSSDARRFFPAGATGSWCRAAGW